MSKTRFYNLFKPITPSLALLSRSFATQPALPSFLAKSGVHLAASPVVGARFNELKQMHAAVNSIPVIRKLQWSIYHSKNYNLIPLEQSELANKIARELFLQYIQKYFPFGITETNIVAWKDKTLESCLNLNRYVISYEPKWDVSVSIDLDGKNGAYFIPPHVVALHEVMHLEEIPKNMQQFHLNRFYWSNEILTTTKTILFLDEIYKTINKIDIDTEVDYQIMLSIGVHKIPLGSFANFYRHLESQHPTLAAGITSPESLHFLTGTAVTHSLKVAARILTSFS